MSSTAQTYTEACCSSKHFHPCIVGTSELESIYDDSKVVLVGYLIHAGHHPRVLVLCTTKRLTGNIQTLPAVAPSRSHVRCLSLCRSHPVNSCVASHADLAYRQTGRSPHVAGNVTTRELIGTPNRYVDSNLQPRSPTKEQTGTSSLDQHKGQHMQCSGTKPEATRNQQLQQLAPGSTQMCCGRITLEPIDMLAGSRPTS